MLTNLNSMQTTIRDLKEIVSKNQGTNHETTVLVRQMEQLVADLENKAKKTNKSSNDIAIAMPFTQSLVT
jgi:hypothetical protein